MGLTAAICHLQCMADFLRSLAAQIIELKYMRERQTRLSWAANNVAHRYIVTTPASVPLLLQHLGEAGAPAGEDIPVEALGSPHTREDYSC